MKQIYLFLIATTTAFYTFSQMPNLEWDRIFQSDQHMAVFLFETDELGNTYFGGYFDDTTVFASDQLGWNVLMSAQPNTNPSGSPYFGKFDADGELIFGGFNFFPSLIAMNDGTAFSTGTIRSYYGLDTFNLPGFSNSQIVLDSGENIGYIQKYDWNGNIEFEHIFYSAGSQIQLGGRAINSNKDLFVIMENSASIDVDFDPNQSEVLQPGHYILKYDQNGVFLDHYVIPIYIDRPNLFIDKNDNFYMVGEIPMGLVIDIDLSIQSVDIFNPHHSDYTSHSAHKFLVKYDAFFNYQWHVKYSDDGSYDSGIVDFDKAGNVYWGESFNDSVYLYEGEILIDTMAEVSAAIGYSSSYIFLTKISPTGQILINETIGGESCDWLRDLEIDNFDNIYLTGAYCNDSLDVDFFGGGTFLPFAANGNTFITKYDVNLNVKWTDSYSSPLESVSPVGVETDGDGHLYTSFNAFSDSIDYQPGSILDYEVFPVNRLGVILKYESQYLELNEEKIPELITLYPNPSNGQFNLQFQELKDEVQVDVYSILGNLIHSENHYQVNSVHSDVQLPAGIYLVKLKADGVKRTLKLVVN